GDIGQGDIAAAVHEGPGHDAQRRQDEEQQREQRKGRDAEPGKGRPAPDPDASGRGTCGTRLLHVAPLHFGGRATSVAKVARRIRSGYCTLAPTTESHFSVTTALVTACSSSVGNTAAS